MGEGGRGSDLLLPVLGEGLRLRNQRLALRAHALNREPHLEHGTDVHTSGFWVLGSDCRVRFAAPGLLTPAAPAPRNPACVLNTRRLHPAAPGLRTPAASAPRNPACVLNT